MHMLTTSFLDKCGRLLGCLRNANKEMEMVSDEVSHPDLRTALNTLSVETAQYAEELTAQLRTHGVEEGVSEQPCATSNPAESNSLHDLEPHDEVLVLCDNTEKNVTQAYMDLLVEVSPIPALKEIVAFQLNALKCAFMKIKLVNEVRHRAHLVSE
jgi:hypothetical protein